MTVTDKAGKVETYVVPITTTLPEKYNITANMVTMDQNAVKKDGLNFVCCLSGVAGGIAAFDYNGNYLADAELPNANTTEDYFVELDKNTGKAVRDWWLKDSFQLNKYEGDVYYGSGDGAPGGVTEDVYKRQGEDCHVIASFDGNGLGISIPDYTCPQSSAGIAYRDHGPAAAIQIGSCIHISAAIVGDIFFFADLHRHFIGISTRPVSYTHLNAAL